MSALRVQAAREGRRLKDVVAEALRAGLELGDDPVSSSRVRLPLVDCAHEASPETELTPERVAEVLLGQEVTGARG